MKYIVFKDNVSGLIQPVIFGEHTSHHQIKIERAKPVSAGFVALGNGELKIYGKSDSLNLEAGKYDLDYIKMMLADLGTVYFSTFYSPVLNYEDDTL